MMKPVVRCWKQKSGKVWMVCREQNIGVLAETKAAGIKELKQYIPEFSLLDLIRETGTQSSTNLKK